MRYWAFSWGATPPAAVLFALACAACASNPASSSAVVPLEVPEPPPHEVSPPLVSSETPQARPAPSIDAGGTHPETTPPSGSTPSASGAASTSPSAANPAATQPANPPVGRSPGAAAELRPAEGGAQTISAPQVRAVIARVSAKLDTFKRSQLSAGKQADYDAARGFLLQADAALKANNLLLAQHSAEKAETLTSGMK
jgi:hypothetical protein